MTIINFIRLTRQKAGIIALILTTLIIITGVITFSQPLRYESNNKLLIQQNIENFDPYNIFKINAYYNDLIKEIVHSETFFNQVLSSNYEIDSLYFGNSRNEQLRTWDKTININSSDIGILEMHAYHPDPAQSRQILLAVNDILINKTSQFQNLDKIDVRIINKISTSKYPQKPNIPLNFIYAIIIGLVISLLYLYYISEQKINEKSGQKNDVYINKTKEEEIKNLNEINQQKEINEEKKDSKQINNNADNFNINRKNEQEITEGEEINLENQIEENGNMNNLFK